MVDAEGTLLGFSCNGSTKVGHYADGKGGQVFKALQTESRDCGYMTPEEIEAFSAAYKAGQYGVLGL